MSDFVIGWLIAAALGLVLGLIVWRVERLAKVAETPEAHQRYGHPHAPLPYLRKRLPAPPSGHVWETFVRHDERGEAFLHLNLMRVADAQVVAKIRRSLVMGEAWSYAQDYREFGMLKSRTFKNELIGPMVDWANTTVTCIASSGQTTEYEIG